MSNTEEKLGHGQVHEFVVSATIAGWKSVDFDTLTKNRSLLARLLPAIRGQAEITAVQHLIDCDAKPFMPDWATGIEEHVPGGQIAWDASKVGLHLDKGQKRGKYVEGHKLREALNGQPVLNANVLDYLLAHPDLIPEDWKGKVVFFWGTIYRHSGGFLYVRYLYWSDGHWHSYCNWLGDECNSDNPAAVLAS